MVIIEKINTTGAFSFGWCKTISLLNTGLVHIFGENGAGKSSIINVIKEILFGKNDTGKSGNHIVNKHKDWLNGTFGCLWLNIGGVAWRIFMLRHWKGVPPDECILNEPSEILASGHKYEGTDVFLETWDGTKWKDERATSIGNKAFKDTQTKIIDLIGMTYDQFSSYVCLGQHAESAMVTGTSGEKEKVIQAIADVSLWDNAANIVNNDCQPTAMGISQSDTKLATLKGMVDTMRPPSSEEVSKLDGEIFDANRTYNVTFTELEQLHTSLGFLEPRVETAYQDIDGIEQEFNLLEAEEKHSRDRFYGRAPVPVPEGMLETSGKISDINSTINSLNRTLIKYKSIGVGKCSQCGQDVTNDLLSKEIDKISTELDHRAKDLLILQETLNVLQGNRDVAEKAANNEAKIKHEEELFSINQARGRLNDRKKIYDEARSALSSLSIQISNKQGGLSLQESRLKSLCDRKQEMSDRVMAYTQYQEAMKGEEANNLSLRDQLDHMRWTERNLRKVKLDEYSYAIDRLNQILPEEITKVWGPGISIRYVNAKEKVTGGIKAEFGLVVSTPNKEGVPVEMYSGGQLKSIVIAVFRSFRRLMNERGKGVNISAIDEIDKDLDDKHVDRLVDALENVVADSPTCLVISHNSRLLNTMQFDKMWEVKMDNEISTINTGA